ncbi:DUF7551 domain-containing protein [Halobellus limi]|jgi:hypothetical protein|uniref:Uncharacterized protein n=1 Tax=Halobellus limi TaxID=699433 RepID=A0A1H5YQ58_9EURY|nr:hypothetical protein [Halobellus limi]QCC48384.1 hypothetical protein DV707_12315 [Halobellus limi]SEG25832.1 hypothetical protein SAMN04488133_1669 [Halobellus limi]
MVGSTLRDISRHVDCLAAPGGPYAVVCGRTGCEPHPVSGLRFDDRDTAAEAAEATAEYRATLRQYDPQVPFYEPLVHDIEDGPGGVSSAAEADARLRYLSFCHDVAGATFEALSDTGLREVESAAMETYLTLAEVVDDRDDFCLTLLWSTMSELAYRASRRQRVTVVEDAARSLRCPDARTAMRPGEGVRATMSELERVGFVDGASVSAGVDDDVWILTFGDYALAERTGRLPTLPLSVALARRLPDTTFRFAAATPLGDRRWRLRVEIGDGPGGLVSVDATDDERLYDTDSEY